MTKTPEEIEARELAAKFWMQYVDPMNLTPVPEGVSLLFFELVMLRKNNEGLKKALEEAEKVIRTATGVLKELNKKDRSDG